MVEGPGTTRNGRKATRLIGAKVKDIETKSRGTKNNSLPATEQQPWWADRHLSGVIKIGKELYLVFKRDKDVNNGNGNEEEDDNDSDDVAIRLHFGMNGSLQVNKSTTTPRADKPTTLQITFESKTTNSENIQILRTYETTISNPMPAKAPTLKYAQLSSHDVCNPPPQFKLRHILDRLHPAQHLSQPIPSIQTSPTTLISDILLNQNILPGIGNIIKVEGLHEARIHPKAPLCSLSRDQLSYAITCCREYAMKWLNDGRAPMKYVYNQTICGTCGEAKISMARVGYTDRTTFWCINCQTMKNSGGGVGKVGAGIGIGATIASTSAIGNSTTRTSNNVRNLDTNVADLTGTSTTEGTQYDPSVATTSTSSTLSKPVATACPGPPPSTTRLYPHETTIDAPSAPGTGMIRKSCPMHGPSTIILRRCKKKTQNDQRIFYTCTARSCNYFCWADVNFPKCQCGKRVVMRVSKTEKSGGRWFFFCAKRGENSRGCGHFQWAERKYLDRYGALLSPLL